MKINSNKLRKFRKCEIYNQITFILLLHAGFGGPLDVELTNLAENRRRYLGLRLIYNENLS
jgi:hypothetical protein